MGNSLKENEKCFKHLSLPESDFSLFESDWLYNDLNSHGKFSSLIGKPLHLILGLATLFFIIVLFLVKKIFHKKQNEKLFRVIVYMWCVPVHVHVCYVILSV